MLKQRVVTALILAPLTIWAIIALPVGGFALLFGVITLLGAWEWGRIVGLQSARQLLFPAAIAIVLGTLYRHLDNHLLINVVAASALAWWLVALLQVVTFPASERFWVRSAWSRAVAGLLILAPAWLAMVLIHQRLGAGYILLLLFLIWGADTGAYFAGRAFGRRKLAPKVSPGKSWEGVYGALLSTVVLALAGYYWLEPSLGLLPFLLLCLLVVMVSILGDLTESLFKRITHIKDSGGLLPGHGGILDRIDSLTAAAPVFALGVLWGI